MDNKASMYYNPATTLSYNKLFNFVLGERGCGKTVNVKKFMLDRFLKYGERFMYVRRFDTELKPAKLSTFFSKLQTIPELRDNYKDKCFGTKNGKFYVDGEVCGWYEPLSSSKLLKSNDYPDVYWIMFEEFLLTKGYHQYLPDEVEMYFLEFYLTIAREIDTKVFFMGNNTSYSNPYFTYFGLRRPYNKNNVFVNGDCLLHVLELKEYRKFFEERRIGKLIKGTTYGKYAIDNISIDDDITFVKKKSGKLIYSCTLWVGGKKLGIWTDAVTANLYVSTDTQDNCSKEFALTNADMSVNRMLLTGYMDYTLKRLQTARNFGCLFFDTEQAYLQGRTILDVL